MITVNKYTIDPHSPEVEMHVQAEILTVATQGDGLCMWAKVDTDKEVITRNFYVVGTGYEIPLQMGIDFEYVGTGFFNDGLVAHLFERIGVQQVSPQEK